MNKAQIDMLAALIRRQQNYHAAIRANDWQAASEPKVEVGGMFGFCRRTARALEKAGLVETWSEPEGLTWAKLVDFTK